MEAADDLDNLIADSLCGVQTALEGEKKAAPSGEQPKTAVGDALRELQQGPPRTEDGPPGPEFFQELVKKFQDENFQKAMADALQGFDGLEAPAAGSSSSAPKEESRPVQGPAPAPASASASASSEGAEEFLQKFVKSFDDAVSSDKDFEKSLTTLMTSMLSNELMCEPLQQIATALEPWLAAQKSLPAEDRRRYEGQLKLYKQILAVYKNSNDPLPDHAREQVQKLLQELHKLGQPPDEVMRAIQPKEAEGGEESFEEFMKQMGLDANLGGAEQDLLRKLADDPEELTKVMKDMAQGLPEEACKQQ